MVVGAGGRGGNEARYLIQLPRDEEDEGGMAEDKEGEGSLSGEGEETANIKEEVRETVFLGGGVGGESGTASLCCSTPRRNVDSNRITVRVQLVFFQPPNHCKDLVDRWNAIDFIFSFQRSQWSGALHIPSAASYIKILVVEVKTFFNT